jgi:hypothetical protein
MYKPLGFKAIKNKLLYAPEESPPDPACKTLARKRRLLFAPMKEVV